MASADRQHRIRTAHRHRLQSSKACCGASRVPGRYKLSTDRPFGIPSSRNSYGDTLKYTRVDVPPVLLGLPGLVTVTGTVPVEPIRKPGTKTVMLLESVSPAIRSRRRCHPEDSSHLKPSDRNRKYNPTENSYVCS